MKVVVACGLGGAPLRPCPFQRGKRLGRPAGGEKAAADLRALLGHAPFLRGHERDVGVDIRLAIRQGLQGGAHHKRMKVPFARLPGSVRQHLPQPLLEVCRTRLTEGRERAIRVSSFLVLPPGRSPVAPFRRPGARHHASGTGSAASANPFPASGGTAVGDGEVHRRATLGRLLS